MNYKHLFSTLCACFLLQGATQVIQAQDYPANPLEKEGYRLIFHDEFEGCEFDKSMYISGFMSPSRTGLHHYDPKKKALHEIKAEATQINQYGINILTILTI